MAGRDIWNRAGMRSWQADGSIERILSGTVHNFHQDQLLDLSVIHGDGTTTAAKKGGDNLGYSGHKHLKGCKVQPSVWMASTIAGPTARRSSIAA